MEAWLVVVVGRKANHVCYFALGETTTGWVFLPDILFSAQLIPELLLVDDDA